VGESVGGKSEGGEGVSECVSEGEGCSGGTKQ
jgi:hypothetical protein